MTTDSTVKLEQALNVIALRQPIINRQSITTEDLQKPIDGIGSLDTADANQLSFLSNPAYNAALEATLAGVVLVTPDKASQVPKHCIAVVIQSPYLGYACVSQLFEYKAPLPTSHNKAANTFIHPTAQIDALAVLGDNVKIDAFTVIGAHTHIGANSHVHANVYIGDNVSLGASCVIFPHVYIGHHCKIGDRVRLHPNTTIGAEGFGFAPMQDTASEGWERIAQLGRVVIGNGVRIGSNSCVDRGAIHDTIIHDNVIIDNLVQVGHNSIIGAGTAMAGKSGLAGSSVLGKRCMIGGAAGVAGHLEITDDVILTGMTMATKPIKESGVYSSGLTAMPSKKWRQVMVKLRAFAESSD